jgi:hypothetical protein
MTDAVTSNTASHRLGNIHSIIWRMILPVPLALIAAIAVVWFALPRLIADNATNDAVISNGQVAKQFKIIRGYYTENVVNKVLKNGAMKTSVGHTGDDNAIPAPATMILDLSGLLAKEDIAISLYSPFPFPNRKDARSTRSSARRGSIWSRTRRRRSADPSRVTARTSCVSPLPTP